MASQLDEIETAVARAVRLVFSGDAEALREMLTEEVAVASDPSFNQSSPLHVAVGENEVECIAAILEKNGASVHCRDVEQRTPLHHLTPTTSPETVQRLVDAGADPNARDMRGFTPLHYAVDAMGADAVEALLVAGADARPTASALVEDKPSLLDVARGLKRMFVDDDQDEDDEPAMPLANYAIAQSLASRLGEDLDPVELPEATLDDHEFQATVFSPPDSRQPMARLRLTLAVYGDDASDESEQDDQALHEFVVDAQLVAVTQSPSSWVTLRCCLASTDAALFELRPDLLLVKGRELAISLSPAAAANLPPV
mmetsp:Transcript_1390/g.4060  ORF Transcript_1390/g.4060 Transcript_1390/m.4060 type:complete len:313 (+) Transcript_1390:92-1030(+)|eukprot:CAMPEP_0198644596 /NCGR_PEP_ID=MMETSP1467-20131203/722_1 /TAXON_ID=1462469 /ORGANISM="unid. sp., Strain CCMP2135" /LENGTH=312 /DNA_ID=CAMNT_0044380057 /DNA_START=74 /DNA_END=1012 /DNA_ORIENTATION=-